MISEIIISFSVYETIGIERSKGRGPRGENFELRKIGSLMGRFSERLQIDSRALNC